MYSMGVYVALALCNTHELSLLPPPRNGILDSPLQLVKMHSKKALYADMLETGHSS